MQHTCTHAHAQMQTHSLLVLDLNMFCKEFEHRVLCDAGETRAQRKAALVAAGNDQQHGGAMHAVTPLLDHLLRLCARRCCNVQEQLQGKRAAEDAVLKDEKEKPHVPFH